jgi:Fur family transcriptional regulator, ferric uptake regulator
MRVIVSVFASMTPVDRRCRFRLQLQLGAEAMSCINTLKAKGLKLTPQRRLIIDAIHNADAHLTAEKIIAHVQRQMPEVHKSTIYRTLEVLEEAGCVYKSELDDHFIYHHADEGHHHHLVCSRCGRTIECDEDVFDRVEKSLIEKYGFDVDFKHLVMSGICRECRNR